MSFDVPTMPLFVHERLSTQAIVETLIGHKTDKQQSLFDLFGDRQHLIADQVMRAYEHQDQELGTWRYEMARSVAAVREILDAL